MENTQFVIEKRGYISTRLQSLVGSNPTHLGQLFLFSLEKRVVLCVVDLFHFPLPCSLVDVCTVYVHNTIRGYLAMSSSETGRVSSVSALSGCSLTFSNW